MKALHFKALYLEFLTAHRTGYLTLLSHMYRHSDALLTSQQPVHSSWKVFRSMSFCRNGGRSQSSDPPHAVVRDTVQKPPDGVFLIAHFSAWRSPRATRIALSGSHMLAGSNGTKPLAPPCAPNPRRAINNSRPGRSQSQLVE